jgi:hypothetical protein
MLDNKKTKNKLNLQEFLIAVLLKTKDTSWDLFKIMIPIIIIIKVLQEVNLLEYIVHPFNYIMQFVGLPEVYSLVWLGAIFNTCYMAMTLVAVFFQDYPLTVEQITVLGIMILISHSLFIEGAIVHKFKVNGFFNIFLRVISSLIFGYLIHITAQYFGWMQERATSPFYTETKFYSKTFLELYNSGVLNIEFNTWLENIWLWLYSQGKTLCLITFVIFVIFVVIELLKSLNIIGKIDALFKPFFSMMRISKSNYTVTSICYLIGLSYGYGLLKEEKQKSPFFKKDQPFKVLSFLAIAHAVIEDGIIFVLLGANGWVVILGRSLWAVFVVVILSWGILPFVSEKAKNKFLYKKS